MNALEFIDQLTVESLQTNAKISSMIGVNEEPSITTVSIISLFRQNE